jgi:hypothetical protein
MSPTGGRPLGLADISHLLKEEENKPKGGSRGSKIDPTEERSINNWFKQQHHFCMPDCAHRSEAPEGSNAAARHNRACWNINCLDKTRSDDDRSVVCVALVKNQWICRYCFLGHYLG